MKFFKTNKNFLLVFSFFGLFFGINIFSIYAENVNNENFFATKTTLEKAKDEGRIFHQLKKSNDEIYLLPQTEFSDEIKEFLFSEKKQNGDYKAEVLYYVKKSELVEKSSDKEKANRDLSIRFVSKKMRSISEMKGMKYYSNTKKRIETLYLESYRIESPDLIKPVPDLTEGSADGKTVYAFQKEHTFGEAIYKVQYHENNKMIALKMANVVPLGLGNFEAVKADDCKICVAVIDDGDGYFVFMGMSVDFKKIPFIENKMNKSFEARLDAIYNWFILQF